MNICNACSGTLCEYPFVKNYYECKNCGCFNKLPRHSYDMQPYEIGYKGMSKEAAEADAYHYIYIIKDIEELHPNKGSLWDIGCYIGGLIWLANGRNWKAKGNDIQKEHCITGRDLYRIDIEEGHFEKVCNEKLDVIVLHHGIEHTLFPILTMEHAIRSLNDNGLIYLVHPCLPDRTFIGQYGDFSDSVGGHRYEWTFKSFKTFLDQFSNKLEVIKSIEGSHDNKNVPSQTWALRKR